VVTSSDCPPDRLPNGLAGFEIVSDFCGFAKRSNIRSFADVQCEGIIANNMVKQIHRSSSQTTRRVYKRMPLYAEVTAMQ
jgi:hypothetical protein